MRCPKCRKETVIALADTETNWDVRRRCVNCGCTFTPVRFTPLEFLDLQLRLKQKEAVEKQQVNTLLDEKAQRDYEESVKYGWRQIDEKEWRPN